MRRSPSVVLAGLVLLGLSAPVRAELLVSVDKDTQTMTVAVDGQTRYTWPVSTGMAGYDTPNGSYKPFRMEAAHRSREWDNAPMPHAVFFSQIGHAIHGTTQTRHLGRPASHGCVRLSPHNAATLFALVKQQKMANSQVVITGATNDAVASIHRPTARTRTVRQRGYDDGYVEAGWAAAPRRSPYRYDPFGDRRADPYARGYGYSYGYDER